jgi:hypothetical protein
MIKNIEKLAEEYVKNLTFMQDDKRVDGTEMAESFRKELCRILVDFYEKTI